MITQEVLDYIKQELRLGKTKPEVIQALLASGWQEHDAEEAFAAANSGQATPPTAPAPVPVATTLPKAGKIFSEAWAIYKARFKTLMAIAVIPTVAGLLFGGSFIGGGLLIQKFVPFNLATLGLVGFLLGIVIVIFLIYLYVWSAVATLFAIKDQAEGIGWKESFKRSKIKINPFFFTLFLAGLATMGGLILLIIPGIIFGLWFSQSSFIVVEENLQTVIALNRSKYYVTGRVGKVFGKLFYIGIISFALYVGVAIIVGMLTVLFKGAYLSWINNLFQLIWAPMATVYGYQLYRHLKSSRP